MPSRMFKHGKHHYYRRKGVKRGGRTFLMRKSGKLYRVRHQRFSPGIDRRRKSSRGLRQRGSWKYAHTGDVGKGLWV